MHAPIFRYVIGTAPPPIGGVSIFVKRRLAALRREKVPHTLKDWTTMTWLGRRIWLLEILFRPRPAVFELNGFETQVMIAMLLRPFPKELVYWVHSGQFTEKLSGWRRRLFLALLGALDECVFVSKHIPPMFRNNGFPVPKRHRIQYAFLPPDEADEEQIWASYDDETRDFLHERSPLMVMQGSDARYQGVDRYGTDLAVDMLIKIADQFPNAGLVVGRPTAKSGWFVEYCEALDQRLAEAGCSHQVLFLEGEQEIWPIVKRSDLFLRPSNQDGDSVSVREAMWFNVPVLASDACPRPESVALFSNRDATDMAEKALRVLEGRFSQAVV